MATCRDCVHFIGSGDWNLCCTESHEGYPFGFLCYEDTPICEKFEKKKIVDREKQIDELFESIYMSGYGLLRKDCDDIAEQLYEEGCRKQSDGEWIWADDGYCRCSNCTQKAPVIRQFDDEPMTQMTRYCPWCGAKMKGGAE